MTVTEIIAACGGVSVIGRRLGMSHAAAVSWRQKDLIPAERAMQLHKAFLIPLWQIRPDLWPPAKPRPPPPLPLFPKHDAGPVQLPIPEL